MNFVKACLCVLVLASLAAAMPLGSSARAAIPGDIQQIISVDYRALRNSDTAQALKQQVQTELSKRQGNIDFVSALRLIDGDPSITDKQNIYAAIIAEAGLTGKIPPDVNKMNEFYQMQATPDERTKLTDAVTKHIRK